MKIQSLCVCLVKYRYNLIQKRLHNKIQPIVLVMYKHTKNTTQHRKVNKYLATWTSPKNRGSTQVLTKSRQYLTLIKHPNNPIIVKILLSTTISTKISNGNQLFIFRYCITYNQEISVWYFEDCYHQLLICWLQIYFTGNMLKEPVNGNICNHWRRQY